MSELLASVEQKYKDLKQLWWSQDFARKMKIRQATIALIYNMVAILTNCRVFLYIGGQVNAYYELGPRTLEEYLDTK